MPAPYDVVAIGSAIVDVVVTVSAAELAAAGLQPGTMTLIGADEAEQLYASCSGGSEVAGGSAANTAFGLASLGGSAAFVGRVGDDALGKVFTEDITGAGVDFESPPASGLAGTGRCIVYVTPDGERTMRTYLGAAPHIGDDCLVGALWDGLGALYLEGYLWDAPSASAAVRRAMDRARGAGARLALSLSDPGCVERHHDEFVALLDGGAVDVLFANEAEILALSGAPGLDAAAESVRGRCRVAALTRGGQGSVVVAGQETVTVAAHPPRRLIDTTGAGDLYAAGFLFGLSRGLSLETCARLGGLAAAEVISVLGGRPPGDLGAPAAAAGLL